MNAQAKVLTAMIFFLAVSFAIFSTADSRGISADKLYALKLQPASGDSDFEPSETDWKNALPLFLKGENGNYHEREKTGDIDKDSVHVTTASCHHGTPSSPPVMISLKAYYTDEELFIRMVWEDATKDSNMFEFTYADGKWNVSEQLEDAAGIMWDTTEGANTFNCNRACHKKLQSTNDISGYSMNTVAGEMMDVWNWKASRTDPLRFADDKFIEPAGVKPDTPSRIYFYNSKLRAKKTLSYYSFDISPLEDGDAPEFDANGNPISEMRWLMTSKAPGVKTMTPTGNRADIKARGKYNNGEWDVTFRRKLITGDKKDVAFNVKRTNTYKFGVAVMDNTLTNHYAVKESITLEFVDGSKAEAGDSEWFL